MEKETEEKINRIKINTRKIILADFVHFYYTRIDELSLGQALKEFEIYENKQ